MSYYTYGRLKFCYQILAFFAFIGTIISAILAVTNQSIDLTKHRLLPQLVTNVSEDMLLMKDEIFGPILPLIGYNNLDEAIDIINKKERPLALYIMSFNNKTQKKVLKQTHSGGVCINDTLMHVSADDAPFGGIGDSGNHRASAYYAADYCAFPVASVEAQKIALPAALSPGLSIK